MLNKSDRIVLADTSVPFFFFFEVVGGCRIVLHCRRVNVHAFCLPQGGKGLHSTLNLHSKKFVGILNGIDTDAWNPATDAFLEVQYSSNDLQGKAENKRAIRRQLGLSSANAWKPMVISSELTYESNGYCFV